MSAGPLGYAGYAGRHDEVRTAWRKSMTELAKRPNITVKVGGLGMAMGWFDFYQQPSPPGSVRVGRGVSGPGSNLA